MTHPRGPVVAAFLASYKRLPKGVCLHRKRRTRVRQRWWPGNAYLAAPGVKSVRPWPSVLPLAILLLAGCLGDGGGSRDDRDDCAGADCATAWPDGLVGPFELAGLTTLAIDSDDGTSLVGGLWLPDLPDGVKAPTLLWQSPYFGACIVHNGPSQNVNPENPASYTPFPCQAAADSMDLYDLHGRIHIRTLVEAGYAVASMNVRGTGNSGGCTDPFGERESDDSAWLVEQLADMPWSNGNVAMVGHSYSGGTPWGAAVRAPPHLKAIVASGLVTDLYTFYHTPQGLASDLHASLLTTLMYENTLPTNPDSGDQVTWPGAERACSNYLLDPAYDLPERAATARSAGFWEAHRYVKGFPNITAAVLVTHGYQEGCPYGHCQQDDAIWDLIPSPKRFILGQWGHDLPPPPQRLENAPFGARWYEDTMIPWLDFWLKGTGPEPDLGVVDWQDDRLEWHRATHPDAATADGEVLYLGAGGLSPEPGAASTFRLLTTGAQDSCAGHKAYWSHRIEEPVLLHGSPVLLLTLESTTPRGLLYADLVVSDGALDGPGCPDGFALHGGGAVDLRFHQGGYAPIDFPVAQPTRVRVDLGSVGLSLQPGQVLSIVLRGGQEAPTAEGLALLSVLADGSPASSQLLLPVAEGTFGGLPPAVTYPQRPFAPEPGPFPFEG